MLPHLLTGSEKEPLIEGERLTRAGPAAGFVAGLLHLGNTQKIATGIVSIGGAGMFDGIVLSGIVAAYLA